MFKPREKWFIGKHAQSYPVFISYKLILQIKLENRQLGKNCMNTICKQSNILGIVLDQYLSFLIKLSIFFVDLKFSTYVRNHKLKAFVMKP